jgi:translation initiation factor IF-2
MAENEGVSIRTYDIIYRLTEDIEKALRGLLEPEKKETVIGHAEVREVFRISKIGKIAGCQVSDGEIRRNANIRVLRGNKLVFEGVLSSLKHYQEDIKVARTGFECGIAIKGFDEFKQGDILESYILEDVSIV